MLSSLMARSVNQLLWLALHHMPARGRSEATLRCSFSSSPQCTNLSVLNNHNCSMAWLNTGYTSVFLHSLSHLPTHLFTHPLVTHFSLARLHAQSSVIHPLPLSYNPSSVFSVSRTGCDVSPLFARTWLVLQNGSVGSTFLQI